MIKLLYDSLNLVISEIKLWAVTGPQLRRKAVESFALQKLDCVERIMHCSMLHCLSERQNWHQLCINSI